MNKNIFMENRLILQNQNAETAPQQSAEEYYHKPEKRQSIHGLTETNKTEGQDMPEEMYDLWHKIVEARKSLSKMEEITENEALAAYADLQSLSDKIGEFKDSIKKNNDIEIGRKNNLLQKIEKLESYVKKLLKESYSQGEDLGLDLNLIRELSDITHFHKKFPDIARYPNSEWILEFNNLSRSNQSLVLGRMIDMIGHQTAGAFFIEDREEQFWKDFAAEQKKQKAGKEYDWSGFVDKYASREQENMQKELLGREDLDKNGEPNGDWLLKFEALSDARKNTVLTELQKNKSSYWSGFYEGYTGVSLGAGLAEIAEKDPVFDRGYEQGKDLAMSMS